MKMRAPSVPLITVDPYFSVWAPDEKLYDSTLQHWTGKPNTTYGYATVDGKKFVIMGEDGEFDDSKQVKLDISVLVTDYSFICGEVKLDVSFYTPLFTDDIYRLSRPVSYMTASYASLDGKVHEVSLEIKCSEEYCINLKGEKLVKAESVEISGASCVRIGSVEQAVLNKDGDDLRIDWGYFYLNAPVGATCTSFTQEGMTFVGVSFALCEDESATVLFGYDDIKALEYFGEKVSAYWKTKTESIELALSEARAEQAEILEKCRKISAEVYASAEKAGGEKYAELLVLSYRQLIAAHKVAVDSDGEMIFVSKECFSNGCAATVDVTYPSSPFFLLYNRELLKGMLRPIFKFAESDEWQFDFAPHDVGTYPLVNGQRYGKDGDEAHYRKCQMPVEECGNMLVMMANIALLDNNTDFFDLYESTLEQWVKYLVEYGADPENQLCTDDFAGHLAHNCNLSLKAIMGIKGYSLVLKMKGDIKNVERYATIASDMAKSWVERAANSDGSFRLAFDKPDTFSMKYNMVWDKLWKTELFAACVYNSEFQSNKKHINPFGMPLDNRKDYTKSDWLVWTACLAPTNDEFEEFIAPLWRAFDSSPSRVPMTDWYDTKNSSMIGFRHRSVQGGLFIKLLENKF